MQIFAVYSPRLKDWPAWLKIYALWGLPTAAISACSGGWQIFLKPLGLPTWRGYLISTMPVIFQTAGVLAAFVTRPIYRARLCLPSPRTF